MDKKIIIGAVILLVIAGGAFYSGMTYTKSKIPARGQFTAGQFSGSDGARGARGGAGGFTAGEVLLKDATSITIKMQDGSTKIVLVSPNTQVLKSVSGTSDDLSVGTNVVVTGAANKDGSVTAQSVQIRPAESASFGGQNRPNQ